MRFKAFFPLVFALSIFWTVGANAQTAESHFRSGLAAFQKGDMKQARTSFLESLQLEPTSPVALYNLALTEQRAGENGMALGLWRKALALHPDYSPADKAIQWTRKHLERPDIPHEVEYWESFRKAALVNVSLTTYVILSASLLLAGGWLMLRFFGTRRRNLLEEKPLPPFPSVATVLLVGFVLFVGLSGAKAWDRAVVRGTVLPKKIEALSTPDQGGTPLFDLYEGLEVIIRHRTGDWTQVTYPGGPTGWIPSSAVFATTDGVKK